MCAGSANSCWHTSRIASLGLLTVAVCSLVSTFMVCSPLLVRLTMSEHPQCQLGAILAISADHEALKVWIIPISTLTTGCPWRCFGRVSHGFLRWHAS